jgi:hypothetical protein
MSGFTYIGVDPGLSGCMLAIDQDKNIISFRDIEKIGDRINVESIIEWLKQFNIDDTLICCENPHIHIGDSIKTCYAAFCYGRSVATVQTIPIVLGYNTTLITPIAWKAYHGLIDAKIKYEEKKAKSVEMAESIFKSEIFKEDKKQGKVTRTILHHDRAEAALMALYLLETHITDTNISR